MDMKYLFLDVDGVLNTPTSKARCCRNYIGIDDAKVVLLQHIIQETGAKIVLHSTWKQNWEKEAYRKWMQDEFADYLDKKLKKQGLFATDKTPDLADGEYLSRGEGIVVFLNGQKWSFFVILDDKQFDYDGCGLTDHIVMTDEKIGLTAELAEKAIKILKNE